MNHSLSKSHKGRGMKVNIYTDSLYAFGVLKDFGMETDRIYDSTWYPLYLLDWILPNS